MKHIHFSGRKRVASRARNDSNYSGDTAPPESCQPRAWLRTSECWEVRVLGKWWLFPRTGLLNIHVETLGDSVKEQYLSLSPRSVSRWILCVSSAWSSKKWNQIWSRNLFCRSLRRLWAMMRVNDLPLFIQPEQNEVTDLRTIPTPTLPSDVSRGFKERVIVIIVVGGESFLKTNLRLVWHLPLAFPVVNAQVSGQGGAAGVDSSAGGSGWSLDSSSSSEAFVSPERFI